MLKNFNRKRQSYAQYHIFVKQDPATFTFSHASSKAELRLQRMFNVHKQRKK